MFVCRSTDRIEEGEGSDYLRLTMEDKSCYSMQTKLSWGHKNRFAGSTRVEYSHFHLPPVDSRRDKEPLISGPMWRESSEHLQGHFGRKLDYRHLMHEMTSHTFLLEVTLRQKCYFFFRQVGIIKFGCVCELHWAETYLYLLHWKLCRGARTEASSDNAGIRQVMLVFYLQTTWESELMCWNC